MTALNLYGLRRLWTWARDIALFIFLLACLVFCWVFNIEWGKP